jgi:hypothetical protein
MEFYERTCVADIVNCCSGTGSSVLYQSCFGKGYTAKGDGGEILPFYFCEFFVDSGVYHDGGGDRGEDVPCEVSSC